MVPRPEIQPRVIRVFVSSTFKDMQIERDELVKRVFPQLRKLCEQRGVTWGEVDLRWGITDEQRAEGRVLPICLEEIHRCRPYFIGLLGERYGWIPDEIPQELIEREPWLAEYRDHSVTELEIMHGVLNDPQMAEHAFFYFRASNYINRLPVKQRKVYQEEPTPEEIRALGSTGAGHRTDTRRLKLAALKERIRKSGISLREDYPDPITLGDWVLKDLTALIDRLYPEGEQPDPLVREAAEHEAFADFRARVYIGRRSYFDQLDAHAKGDTPPLVILGESGSGKSALLANWALEYRTAHPSDLVLFHFIGASPYSADWAAMLRRIMGELKGRFDIQEEIPDKPDALRSAFVNWLHMASARGKVILILDGLNQLEDRDGARSLVWLPPVMPNNVRLLVSTLPGQPLDELQKHGWPELLVEPLEFDERKLLIQQYLSLFTKSLDAVRIDRIAGARQCQNPLYLRVFLDELRLFGVYERLDQLIDHYLEARTPSNLYEKVLERCEQDYESEWPGLVRDTLSLLWAARRGLSEIELLDLLSEEQKPLPPAVWYPFYLAIEHAFILRSGLIGFANSHIRESVERRYLSDEVDRKNIHLSIARYFHKQELFTISTVNNRRVEEESWQLIQSEAWSSLYDVLTDLIFFMVAWRMNEFDYRASWVALEDGSGFRLVRGFEEVVDIPGIYDRPVTENVSRLLVKMGHVDEAKKIFAYLAESSRRDGDKKGLQQSLLQLAEIIRLHGDLAGAMERIKEAEAISRESMDELGLAASLGIQALIYRAWGRLEESSVLLEQQENLFRQLDNKPGLIAAIGNRVLILRDQGNLKGALRLNKDVEHLSREIGDIDSLQATLGNQALIRLDNGEIDAALELSLEKESLCSGMGNLIGLQSAVGIQAMIHVRQCDLDKALELERRAESICRSLGYNVGLQETLNNQAAIHEKKGDHLTALELSREATRLCRSMGNNAKLTVLLANQATIQVSLGDLQEAIRLYEEMEETCRVLNDKPGLVQAIGGQARIYLQYGDMEKALLRLGEQERLCSELEDKLGLVRILLTQAQIHHVRGNDTTVAEIVSRMRGLISESGDSGLERVQNALREIEQDLR